MRQPSASVGYQVTAKWIGEVIYVYTKADRTLAAFCIVGLLKLRIV